MSKAVLPIGCATVALALLAGSANGQQLLPGQRYPLGGLGQGAGASGDLNGDGLPDLATADTVADAVSVVFADGAGGFLPPLTFTVGDYPFDIVIADVDADGWPDIATLNQNSDDVSLLLGTGGGGFAAQTRFPVANYPIDLVAADFDADGFPDLVSTHNNTDSVSVLLADGSGGFLPYRPFEAGSGPLQLDAGDVDEDGDIDLVIHTDFGLTLLPGNGGGGFLPPQNLDLGFSGDAVTVADMNADGHLDLLWPSYSSHTLTLHPGDGTGHFTTLPFIVLPQAPLGAFCTDIDGDGLRDILTANGDDNPYAPADHPGSVCVLLAREPGRFAPPFVLGTGGPNRFLLDADLNGDGLRDLATPNGGSDVSVLLASGPGAFDAPLALEPLLEEATDTEIADLDGDARPDLVSCSGFESKLSVLFGQPGGGFAPATVLDVDEPSRALAVADVNGDAIPDVVTASSPSGVSVLLGDGAGGIAARTIYPTGTFQMRLELGDLNGDAAPDIVTASSSGTVWVLLNDGSGGFLPATSHVVNAPLFALALADVDADGRLDVVTEKSKLTPPAVSDASVLLGDGAGGFAPPVVTALTPSQIAMSVGDVNGDGLPDLVTASLGTVTAGIQVRPGLGNGAFAPPSLQIAGSGGNLTLADVNGDGRQDLLSGGSSAVFVRLGDGAGSFAAALTFGTTSSVEGIEVADLDGDAAPDVAVNSITGGKFPGTALCVLFNLSPDWAWSDLGSGLPGTHGTPALAGHGALVAGNLVALTLEDALENTGAALVIGLSTVNVPFKGGVFVPHADIIVALPTGLRGELSFTAAWPALVPPGLQVFLQCWIDDPAGPQGFAASNAVSATAP